MSETAGLSHYWVTNWS